jgi:hypothetical protein
VGQLFNSLFAIALAVRLFYRQQQHARPLLMSHLIDKSLPDSDRATIPSLASILHDSEPAPHGSQNEIEWLFDGSGDEALVRDLIQSNSEDAERGLLPMDRFLDFA